MINEAPYPVFGGWNALFIVMLFLVNLLLALIASNREIKVSWTFIRSISNWRFLYGFYQVYPDHTFRIVAIAGLLSLYVKMFAFDKKAAVALVASISLVMSDTPKIRRVIWTGPNSGAIQKSLVVLSLILLGGWRVYRWFVLLAMYLVNNLLLGPDLMTPDGQIARHQYWLVAASLPVMMVFLCLATNGLPPYTAPLYIVALLLFLRPNSPSNNIKKIRSILVCSLGVLLELFVFGLGVKFVLLSICVVVYLIFIA